MKKDYYDSPLFATAWPQALVAAELDRLTKETNIRRPGSRGYGTSFSNVWSEQVEWFLREAFHDSGVVTEWQRAAEAEEPDPWERPRPRSETPGLLWLQLLRSNVDRLPTHVRTAPYWSQRQRPQETPKRLDQAQTATAFAALVRSLEETGYLAWAFGQDCVDDACPGQVGDPEQVIAAALGKERMWPVPDWYGRYDLEDLFDMIEFVSDYVRRPRRATWHDYGQCGHHYTDFDAQLGRQVYRARINELLDRSDLGLTLGEDGRLAHKAPAGVEQLVDEVTEVPGVHDLDGDELRHALQLFRTRHASTLDKRAAVLLLAGILERRRQLVKDEMLRGDEGAIFQIANKFAIRHQGADQARDYDPDLYLEWVFYSYLATIHLTNRIVAERAGSDLAS